jgi:hypothetical protein
VTQILSLYYNSGVFPSTSFDTEVTKWFLNEKGLSGVHAWHWTVVSHIMQPFVQSILAKHTIRALKCKPCAMAETSEKKKTTTTTTT